MDYFRPPGYRTEREPWSDADYCGAILVVIVLIAATVWMPVGWAIKHVSDLVKGEGDAKA
ncbi:MAG: hypothetical protein KKD97_16105 [Gammaproteobacteria bacterium]|nr:hypothetical protein [Gammaproteobacteria bacterium]